MGKLTRFENHYLKRTEEYDKSKQYKKKKIMAFRNSRKYKKLHKKMKPELIYIIFYKEYLVTIETL